MLWADVELDCNALMTLGILGPNEHVVRSITKTNDSILIDYLIELFVELVSSVSGAGLADFLLDSCFVPVDRRTRKLLSNEIPPISFDFQS